jgi:hypothetical protein
MVVVFLDRSGLLGLSKYHKSVRANNWFERVRVHEKFPPLRAETLLLS